MYTALTFPKSPKHTVAPLSTTSIASHPYLVNLPDAVLRLLFPMPTFCSGSGTLLRIYLIFGPFRIGGDGSGGVTATTTVEVARRCKCVG